MNPPEAAVDARGVTLPAGFSVERLTGRDSCVLTGLVR